MRKGETEGGYDEPSRQCAAEDLTGRVRPGADGLCLRRFCLRQGSTTVVLLGGEQLVIRRMPVSHRDRPSCPIAVACRYSAKPRRRGGETAGNRKRHHPS